MLTTNELKNLKYFLMNGRWNLTVQEGSELLNLTQKVEKLLSPEVLPEEVKEPEEIA